MLPSLRLKVKMREPVAERRRHLDCNACDATLRHFDASAVDNEHHDWQTHREDDNTPSHTQHGRKIMSCISPILDHG